MKASGNRPEKVKQSGETGGLHKDAGSYGFNGSAKPSHRPALVRWGAIARSYCRGGRLAVAAYSQSNPTLHLRAPIANFPHLCRLAGDAYQPIGCLFPRPHL
jgi:hypothetical protein